MLLAVDIGHSGATAVAAGNIAKALSTAVAAPNGSQATGNQQDASNQRGGGGDAGLQPLRADQTSDVNDGVRVVTVRPIDLPPIAAFDPNDPDAGANGTVARPDVALEREFVELTIAKRAYEASLATIHTADQTLGGLLDREF